MKLGIYSLKRALFQGEAESLNCRTENGEITVLDGHRPLISVLESGALKIVDADKKEVYIPISSGFLAVHAGSEVKLIVEEGAA